MARGESERASEAKQVYDALPAEAKTQAALDAMFSLRHAGGDVAPRQGVAVASEGAAAADPTLTLRNPRTGETAAA